MSYWNITLTDTYESCPQGVEITLCKVNLK